jgi:hypothetical protein
MKNDHRRLPFKKRVGTVCIARAKRTTATDVVLQTTHELDEPDVLSTSLLQDDVIGDRDCSSNLYSHFKERVEDLLLDGMGAILITTPERQELTSEINQDYTRQIHC